MALSAPGRSLAMVGIHDERSRADGTDGRSSVIVEVVVPLANEPVALRCEISGFQGM